MDSEEKLGPQRHVVMLDNIRSVFNVGSIYRTSDCVGIAEAWLCGVTPGPTDRFNRPRKDFAKISLGAEHTCVSRRFNTTLDALQQARKDGYVVVALEQAATSIDYRDFVLAPHQKLALVVGTEVEGLSTELLAACDHIIEIPIAGVKESLNVSIAFSVAAFSLLGQGLKLQR